MTLLNNTCWGTTIWLPITTLKTSPHDVMSNAIKDLNVSSSSPISFKVEWHSSRSNKWYQSQGHRLESRECHCEGRIVGETIIWLSTTTLKTGPRGVISNAIKDLNVPSSSPIGFEVEWHSSRSDKWYQSQGHRSVIVRERLLGGPQFDSVQPL